MKKWKIEIIQVFMVFVYFCLQLISQFRTMCFIKKVDYSMEPYVCPCEHQCYLYGMNYTSSNSSIQTISPQQNDDFQYPFLRQQFTFQTSSEIYAIAQRIQSNNEAIFSFVERLSQNQALIQSAEVELEESLTKEQKFQHSSIMRQPHCQLNEIPFFSSQAIITKIFGRKEYKFKLTPHSFFPKIIYKQRNLSIALKLINPNKQQLVNANLIHLCMGVCTNQGQWIIPEDGDYFMQGKIQVDLYHGEAQFKKISPKDVTRHFSGGNFNIVIYAKKSLVNFTGEVAKYQKVIETDLIEPLVIRDVVVKAKKKTRA